jgi:hypothetical protein
MLGSMSDLGPISPELALVDPELAERARQRLPGPGQQHAVDDSSAPAVLEQREAPRPPLPGRGPRRRRALLLGACTLAVGAIAGWFVGDKHAHVPRPMLEAQAFPPTTASNGGVTAGEAPLRAPRRAREQPPPRTPARIVWAANVIGVAAHIGHPAVITLVWQKPAESNHVVVVRTLGARRRGVVVYHGSATSYRDVEARPCTAYRYTIVNYDRRGHRSSGVPTTIVTDGCGARQ